MNTTLMRRLLTALLLLMAIPFCVHAKDEIYTPQVKFHLKSANYMTTLIWLSGYSYAITEIARANKAKKINGTYCLPEKGYIGYKPLLGMLNNEYKGQTITFELVSKKLLEEVQRLYPCK